MGAEDGAAEGKDVGPPDELLEGALVGATEGEALGLTLGESVLVSYYRKGEDVRL